MGPHRGGTRGVVRNPPGMKKVAGQEEEITARAAGGTLRLRRLRDLTEHVFREQRVERAGRVDGEPGVDR